MNNLSNRLGYKSKINAYLNQLSELANKPVYETDLGTLEEVEAVKQKSQSLLSCEKVTFEIDLDDLKSNRFSTFLKKLGEASSGPLYIWLDSTNICGAYLLAKASDFNLNFDTKLMPEGVIVLLTESCQGKLLLDFDTENVEVELQGEVWSKIKY